MNGISSAGSSAFANGTGAYTSFLPAESASAPTHIFESHQADDVPRATRSARTVITEKLSAVPFNTEKFGDGIRQQLDSVIERSKCLDVSRIQIIGNISQTGALSASGSPIWGAWSANAVKRYLVGKDVDPNRIIVRGQGVASSNAPGAVEVRFIGLPRQ